jgi:hypothetical protein
MSLVVIESETPKVITSTTFNEESVQIIKSETLDNDVVHHIRIPVNLDLRNAITSNAKKMQIRTLKNNFDNLTYASQVFPNYENINALNSWALSQNQTTITDAILNLKQQTINIFDVDFTNLINNQLVGKINTLSDVEFFGTRTRVVTEQATPSNQNQTNITLNLNDPYAGDNENLSFQQASETLYYYGKDPASAFQSFEDELSYKKVKHGLIKKTYSKPRQQDKIKKLYSTLRGVFSDLGTPTEVTQINTTTPSTIDFRTYEISESLRYQAVNFDFTIKQSEIDAASGKVHLVITVLNNNNLFLETFSINFVFVNAVESSGLNLFYPDLKVSARRAGINRSIPCLSITNNGVVSVSANIYAKVTRECQSRLTTDFQSFAVIPLKPNETRTVYGINTNETYDSADNSGTTNQSDFPIIASGGSVFFRVVAEALNDHLMVSSVPLNNTFYAQLDSPVLESNVFIPITAQIFNNDTNPFIELQVDRVPLNAKRIIVLKRNLTKKERKFRQLESNDRLKVARVFEGNNIVNTEIVKVDSVFGPFSKNQQVVFTDYDLKNDNTYEYKVFVDYSNSKKFSSINSCIVEFVERQNVISLDVIEDSIEPLLGETFNHSVALNVNEIKTDAERLFEDLPGDLFDIFSEDLSEIRSAFSSSKKFKIFRYDRVYGENVALESVNMQTDDEGNKFISFVSTGLRKGGSYLYEIHPHVMNSSQLASLLRSRLQALPLRMTDAGLKAKIKALILKIEEESSIDGKYSTRSAILRGTIETERSSYVKYGGDFYADGKTGDYFYLEAETPDYNIRITDQNVSLKEIMTKKRLEGKISKRNSILTKAPLLNFRVTGDINFIDYFVLISEKNGVRSIVGSAHHVKDEEEFNFFDVSQLDYQGAINYYVIPVFEDGDVGESVLVGSAILSGRD